MRSISNEELKANVSYDPETGIFTRLRDASINAPAGSRADLPEGKRYRAVKINYVRYKAHRLAFQYVHGREPKGYIDHINGNPNDNRIANLRECDALENARNARTRSDNTSGFKGVSWHKQRGKWTARIMVSNQHINIGLFDTAEQAYAAYCAKAKELHGEFARLA